MTNEPPGRQPDRAQLWHPGTMLEAHVSAEQAGDRLRGDPEAMAWLILPRESSSAFQRAAQAFGLDALAQEDVLGSDEGCKIDWLDDTMVLVTSFAQYNPDATPAPASGRRVPQATRQAVDLEILPVSIIAGRHALVVLADDSVRAALGKGLEQGRPELLGDGIAGALHLVLDTIVDSYSEALTQLTDQTDELSDLLFDNKPLTKADQLRAFRLRRALGRLRRTIDPMVDITAGLSNAARREKGQDSTDPAEELLGTQSAREFGDVADHAAHASATGRSLREEINSMYETNLSLSDVHLNSVMKKLAGWAAIIAVPTLITGFMGMNVPYPGFSQWSGFLTALIVMVVAVVGLYLLFRRKDWL